MAADSSASTQQAKTLLARLAESAGRVEADDLSGLAQMHGWCETLIDLSSQDQAAVNEQMKGELGRVAHLLEALILGEAVSAAEALSEINRQVAGLTGTVASTVAEATANAAPIDEFAVESPIAGLDQNQVAEKMADIFDEVPAEPAMPAPQTAAPVAAPPPAAPAPAATIYVSEPLTIDIKEFDFVKGFVEEAREHIESIEAAVLEVERAPTDTAKIDDLFRPFHTIKGMAGFLNLRDISSLTHEAETLLDQGRKGKRTITPATIDLVLGVGDILKAQIVAISQWVANPNPNPVPQPPVAEMIDRLRAVVTGQIDLEAQTGPASPRQSTAAPPPAPAIPKPEPVAAAPQASAPVKPKPAPAAPAAPAVPPATVAASAPPATISAETKSAEAPSTAAAAKLGDQSIRIDTEKLDALIDMVGELVIAQTLVSMSGDVTASPKLAKDVNQVAKIVRDVQGMAMSMRMVPIGPTFQKMARLVRDVSRKAGKKVNLTISGEDTELDKTVIQEIGDPLVHMVRNAVDHGVESPEGRLAVGKPETGAVHLHAGHEGGNIVISIRDDGKGLDRDVLVAKAIEKGLVHPGEELTDQQAFALVFAPGFSTAAQVTDISGRGVGMDVVKRNIESLRGRVEITSEKGRGTTFIIRLPLTLAIIDGMVIRVGSERFIVPTITIQQSLRPLPEAITTVQHRGEVLNVRGELIPLVQLGELFGLTGRVDPCQAMVVITQAEGRLIGLVVEELIGQQQVVIKTLGERFERLKGISGAAILGDGRVGLILETAGLACAYDRRIGSAACRIDAAGNQPSIVTTTTPSGTEVTDQGAAPATPPAAVPV